MKIVYGTVLYVHDFDFGDGERRNKYVVILGAKTGHNLAGIVTTSKAWRSVSDEDYCFIDDGGGIFPKKTWAVVKRLFEIDATQLHTQHYDIAGRLPSVTADELRTRVKNHQDVAKFLISLLE